MAYVKCNYGEGMFSSEYFIDFGDGVEYNVPFGGMFVNKEDVIPYKEKEFTGLVKAALQEFSKDKALVSINDVGEHRLSRLWVPKDHVLIGLGETHVAMVIERDETHIGLVLSLNYRYRHE